jgi:serine/threonine-protein phosphatase PGAM5
MAKKILILIRHGQYFPAGLITNAASTSSMERLTPLGRKQARAIGKRLSEMGVTRLVHSTMPRAIETAYIIHQHLILSKGGLRKLQMKECDELRECVPGFPAKLRAKYGFTDLRKLRADKTQADRAFAKHFQFLPAGARRDSVEVLVTHGNIIRYLVCRTLEIDPLAWRKMDIQQCGMTVIKVDRKGNSPMALLSHNDVGHIELKDRTFL